MQPYCSNTVTLNTIVFQLHLVLGDNRHRVIIMAERLGLSLSAFPVFDTQIDPTSIGPRWRKWMLRFENRIKAMNLTDPERKLALLLDYAGDDVHDDYLTLTVPPAAGGNNPPAGNDIYAISSSTEQSVRSTSSERIRDL